MFLRPRKQVRSATGSTQIGVDPGSHEVESSDSSQGKVQA